MNWYRQAKQADIDWRSLGKGTGVGAGIGLGLLTLLNNPGKDQIQPQLQQTQQEQPSAEPTEPPISEKIEERKEYETNSQDIFVARVIFSEAANVSDKERELVASVIRNRIGHPGFNMGKLESMNDVVNQKNAFEAIDDPDNDNWERSKLPEYMAGKERHAWTHALSLASGNFEPASGPSGRPLVYYHDKSISKTPSSWNNRYWKAVPEIETQHFVFYSILPSEK